jgi:hypothetical protein
MLRKVVACLFFLAAFFAVAQDVDDLDLLLGDPDGGDPELLLSLQEGGALDLSETDLELEEQEIVMVVPALEELEFVVIPGGVAITGYSGEARGIVIPGEIQGLATLAIGNGAFAGKGLAALSLPESLAYIGSRGFADNQIGALALPPALRKIDSWAFAGNLLEELEIPDSVTVIMHRAFENNQLVFVSLGKGLSVIGDGAFAGNFLGGVLIPDSVTVIGDGAFEDNRIFNIILGGGVIAIGGRAFAGNPLSGVIIPPSLDSLGPEAFGVKPLRYSYDGRVVVGQKALEQELRRRPLTASFLSR